MARRERRRRTRGRSRGTPSGSYNETSYTDAWWSATSTNILYITLKQLTTTNPVVSTGNNGSNAATTTDRFIRKDGTTAFMLAADGIYDYAQYTNGQMTKQVRDVITTDSFPSGDDPNTDFGITETGSGCDRTTTYAYDAQARLSTTTLPTGRIMENYYSHLKDGRLVSVAWPRSVTSMGTTTRYGPASYNVANFKGKSEASGVIAITSSGSTAALTAWIDETTADPILAVTTGTLASLKTSIYNESASQLTEARAYFSLPGSGAGSAGTNYDSTLFGYDDSGRKWRTKTAAGTITRTVFDELGRAYQTHMGTNDHSFTDGEAGGSDNMVKVSELTFDSGSAGGNSLVTNRAAFIQGSSTGERDTGYTYDYRGRVLLTTNAQAPHALVKLDNMGRTLAAAMYSSTGSITVGTTDPAGSGSSDKANRVALNETAYDQMGRVYKTTRHNITQATGVDADSIDSLSWYDPAGRLIKTFGESGHQKYRNDRLGRRIQTFMLATDDDSQYGHASASTAVWNTTSNQTSVAGDTVLQEDQTCYESTDSDNVLMRVSIARHYSDLASGTTGELDLNADGGSAGTGTLLTLTAVDVMGRVQITGMWYDAIDRLTDTVRYSNITTLVDSVHTDGSGNHVADAVYTMDNLNRLTQTRTGKIVTGAITTGGNERHEEVWVLDQQGNAQYQLDLTGDNSFSDPGEQNDTRTYSAANELLTRDLDSTPGTTGDNYTLTYDDNGNQTSNAKDKKYVWDAFGRLVKVTDLSNNLIAQYAYNGLGFRTMWWYDTTRSGGGDPDGTVDSYDPKYFFCYDDRWRVVATFRYLASDGSSHSEDPKEAFVYQNAGLGGYGSSSYIDDVVIRGSDDTGWVNLSDGIGDFNYYCQDNIRHDVVAMLFSDGELLESEQYTSNGRPVGDPVGDVNGDYVYDASDDALITGAYAVTKDTNLDGVINASDVTWAGHPTGTYQALGLDVLSSAGVMNRKGYCGYESDPVTGLDAVRYRWLEHEQGGWLSRDPLPYVDGMNLYAYVAGDPVRSEDPTGLVPPAQCIKYQPTVVPPYSPGTWPMSRATGTLTFDYTVYGDRRDNGYNFYLRAAITNSSINWVIGGTVTETFNATPVNTETISPRSAGFRYDCVTVYDPPTRSYFGVMRITGPLGAVGSRTYLAGWDTVARLSWVDTTLNVFATLSSSTGTSYFDTATSFATWQVTGRVEFLVVPPKLSLGTWVTPSWTTGLLTSPSVQHRCTCCMWRDPVTGQVVDHCDGDSIGSSNGPQ